MWRTSSSPCTSDLDAHPLVAVVGLRRRVDAVRGAEHAVHDDVRAGRAEVGGGARLAVAEPAEQLHFERDGEVLVLQHRLRARATCSISPLLRMAQAGPAGHLLADEAVLGREEVVRERILVEHVAELAVEGRPLVVADLEQAVLDADGRRTGSRRAAYLANFGVQPVRSLPLNSWIHSSVSAASGARRARTGAPAAAMASAPAASARTRGAAASRPAAGAVMRAPVGVYRPAAYNRLTGGSRYPLQRTTLLAKRRTAHCHSAAS